MTTLEKIEQIDKWLVEYKANDIYDLIEKAVTYSKRIASNMYYDLNGSWGYVIRNNPDKTCGELGDQILKEISNRLEKWEKKLK